MSTQRERGREGEREGGGREGQERNNTGNVPVLLCKFSSLFLDVPKSSKVY